MGLKSIYTELPTGQRFAVIDASVSGDNTIVALVAGAKIRVLSYALVCAAAVDVRFESNAGGAALTGLMSFDANGGISVPHSWVGHFETVAGQLLNLELSGAIQVSGHITYMEIP